MLVQPAEEGSPLPHAREVSPRLRASLTRPFRAHDALPGGVLVEREHHEFRGCALPGGHDQADLASRDVGGRGPQTHSGAHRCAPVHHRCHAQVV